MERNGSHTPEQTQETTTAVNAKKDGEVLSQSGEAIRPIADEHWEMTRRAILAEQILNARNGK